MQYVDTDGDATTFDSSSATLDLPHGATVVFAGLYWGARTSAGTSGAAARNAAAKKKIKLRVPGGSYEESTADLGAASTATPTRTTRTSPPRCGPRPRALRRRRRRR
jgi:hypothetical protein